MATSNDDSSHYEGALLEDIRDNVKQLAEAISGVSETVSHVNCRLGNVEKDTALIPSIKAAVTDQSKELSAHEKRITKLEKAAT